MTSPVGPGQVRRPPRYDTDLLAEVVRRQDEQDRRRTSAPSGDSLVRRPTLVDSSGAVILSYDPAGGLALPYLHTPMHQVPSASYPINTTGWCVGASTSPVSVWEAVFPRQQRALHLRLIVGVVTSGATASYQLTASDGTNSSDPVLFSSSVVGGTVIEQEIALPSATSPLALVQVLVQASRSAGTGNVYCHVTDSWQKPVG